MRALGQGRAAAGGPRRADYDHGVRYGTVLFDLDGTLIDSGSLILASFRHATQTVLGRVIADEVLMANVGGHGIHAQMRELDEERADELVRVYREHNMSIYRRVSAFPGIPEQLDRLREQGRRLGIVTVKSRPTVELTLEVLPFLRRFETVVTGDDTERHKPEPEPLLLALSRLGVEPAGAAYVGDSPFDIRAAKAAGMAAVAVGWGKIHPLSRLEAEGPDEIVHEPAELADVL
jgi:pyrophosphatase PpaX